MAILAHSSGSWTARRRETIIAGPVSILAHIFDQEWDVPMSLDATKALP